jgi:hypothetical protein
VQLEAPAARTEVRSTRAVVPARDGPVRGAIYTLGYGAEHPSSFALVPARYTQTRSPPQGFPTACGTGTALVRSYFWNGGAAPLPGVNTRLPVGGSDHRRRRCGHEARRASVRSHRDPQPDNRTGHRCASSQLILSMRQSLHRVDHSGANCVDRRVLNVPQA